MRFYISRRGVRLLTLLIAAFSLAPISRARAQFKLVHAAEDLRTTQDINLYLGFSGSGRFDGIFLTLPSAWSLEDVRHLSPDGCSSMLAVQELESMTNRFLLVLEGGMEEEDVLVLRVNTGLSEGRSSIRVTPYQTRFDRTGVHRELLEGLTLLQPFRITRQRPIPGNLVLDVSDGDVPVRMRAAALPDLSSGASYTIEFWLKTASLGAVVLSTWNGLESSSYPIELLVDGTGRLIYFQGTPGEHRSMRPNMRIADGTWHHVAVSHDAVERWSRIFIDGLAADSLFHAVPLVVQATGDLVLSGRPSADDADSVNGFSGQIDEFRVWPYARDAKEIRLTMRQSISGQASGMTVLSFDDPEQEGRLIDDAGSLRRQESDLSFYEPIRGLQIHLDVSSVLLEWQAPDRNATAFVIERSTDGSRYDVIGQLERTNDGVGGSNIGDEQFRFRDTGMLMGVSFYRVRQLFRDGTDRASPAVKVGMGVEDENTTAILRGNFPNPFNPTTTITYTLREAQHVSVSIWDLSGQMIALLVDGSQEAGEYQVAFEATDLPSGNYFVRMRTATGVRTHQMILMK